MNPLARVHRNIALTGFMAAGKTVVSRRLARRLDWQFVDLDHVIETNLGLSVESVFALHGEASFRKAEKRALAEVLEREEQVIALGGGAVLDPESLALLRQNGLLIWLKVSPQAVLERTRHKNHRPLLQGGDKLRRIEELAAQREDIYARAHVAIDTNGRSVDDVVDEILKIVDSGN